MEVMWRVSEESEYKKFRALCMSATINTLERRGWEGGTEDIIELMGGQEWADSRSIPHFQSKAPWAKTPRRTRDVAEYCVNTTRKG